MIITICGSIHLAKEIQEVAVKYSLLGNIVLTPILTDRELTEDEVKVAKSLHYDKIRLSDYVIVVVKNWRIGPYTLKEIEFAEKLGLNMEIINYYE
jgi:hypothetical protein